MTFSTRFAAMLMLIVAAACSAASAAPAPPVRLTMRWQQTLPTNVRRAAVADVRGNGTIRLITDASDQKIGERIVTVWSWDAARKVLVQDAAIKTSEQADRLEVGHFASDGSVVIAMPGGYLRYEGGGYVYHAGTPSIAMVGGIRLKNGKEALSVFTGAGVASVIIDSKGVDGAWTTAGPTLPPGFSNDYSWGDVRGPELPIPEVAPQVGIPGDTQDLTFFGAWTPARSDHLLLYAPKHVAAGADKGDYAAVYAPSPDPGDGVVDPASTVWTSAALGGKVLDIAPGPDLRTGNGDGLYVLSEAPSPAVGRTLTFFIVNAPA